MQNRFRRDSKAKYQAKNPNHQGQASRKREVATNVLGGSHLYVYEELNQKRGENVKKPRTDDSVGHDFLSFPEVPQTTIPLYWPTKTALFTSAVNFEEVHLAELVSKLSI